MAIRSASSSSINGSDKMLGVELMPLSRVRWIYDGASIFHLIIMYIRIIVKHSSFNLLQTPMMLPHITLRSQSSALNVDHYKSLDGCHGFTPFYNMTHCLMRVCLVTLQVSENQLSQLIHLISCFKMCQVACIKNKNKKSRIENAK